MIDAYLLSGTLNAIPNAIVDLLRFLPREIKIYSSDLMLTHDYRQGYAQNSSRNISLGFIIHDPIAQYNILHCLWRHGAITGDARFISIMEMGAEVYIAELQKSWCWNIASVQQQYL